MMYLFGFLTVGGIVASFFGNDQERIQCTLWVIVAMQIFLYEKAKMDRHD